MEHIRALKCSIRVGFRALKCLNSATGSTSYGLTETTVYWAAIAAINENIDLTQPLMSLAHQLVYFPNSGLCRYARCLMLFYN